MHIRFYYSFVLYLHIENFNIVFIFLAILLNEVNALDYNRLILVVVSSQLQIGLAAEIDFYVGIHSLEAADLLVGEEVLLCLIISLVEVLDLALHLDDLTAPCVEQQDGFILELG